MEQSFWDARWRAGQTGFHLDQPNPALLEHWDAFVLWLAGPAPEASTVLVPLCGKSHDLAWLGARTRSVVGVEFVERAALDYFGERALTPEVEPGTPLGYRAGNTRIIVADFLRVPSARLGPIDFVYDRAAWVAVAPETRLDYLVHLGTLLSKGSGVLLLTFEHDLGSGPPFSIADVPALFDAARRRGQPFTLERRTTRDVLATEPRFRERGASYFREVVWFARKEAP